MYKRQAHHGPENFFISGIKVLISFIILSGMNVTLTLMIFAVLPFMIFFTRFFNRRMRAASKDCRHQVGEINAQVEDTLLGIRVVKSFANEKLEEEKFAKGNLRFLECKKRQYAYMAGFGTSNRLFDGLMYIIVVVAGALFLINKKIGIGDYTAYLLYVSTLLSSIRTCLVYTSHTQCLRSALLNLRQKFRRSHLLHAQHIAALAPGSIGSAERIQRAAACLLYTS